MHNAHDRFYPDDVVVHRLQAPDGPLWQLSFLERAGDEERDLAVHVFLEDRLRQLLLAELHMDAS